MDLFLIQCFGVAIFAVPIFFWVRCKATISRWVFTSIAGLVAGHSLACNYNGFAYVSALGIIHALLLFIQHKSNIPGTFKHTIYANIKRLVIALVAVYILYRILQQIDLFLPIALFIFCYPYCCWMVFVSDLVAKELEYLFHHEELK